MEEKSLVLVYGIIYKCTNLINNKVYVGQTINGLDRRRKAHICLSKSGRGTYFHHALAKYGCENFRWEIIDSASSLESLNFKEKYYIITNRCLKQGYNICEGGSNGYPIRGKTDKEKSQIYQKISQSLTSKSSEEKARIRDSIRDSLILYNRRLTESEKKVINSHKSLGWTNELRIKVGDRLRQVWLNMKPDELEEALKKRKISVEIFYKNASSEWRETFSTICANNSQRYWDSLPIEERKIRCQQASYALKTFKENASEEEKCEINKKIAEHFSNTVWVNDGVHDYRVSKDYLFNKSMKSLKLGRIYRPKEESIEKQKRASKDYYKNISEDVLKDRYKKISDSKKGKIWINNGKQQIMICEEDYNKYPSYNRGMIKRRPT